MGSTRLPGKVMMDLHGEPLIHHILTRIKSVRTIDQVIVATTTNPEDDRLAEYVRQQGVLAFRGDALDVLGRFHGCAQEFVAGLPDPCIMRLTADNALIDPAILGDAVMYFQRFRPDYLRYGTGLPIGMIQEVFSFDSLVVAHREAKDQACREHVTPYLYWNKDCFKCFEYVWEHELGPLRWTVDTEQDLALVRAIYHELYDKSPLFSCADILDAYPSHPEWREINAHIQQIQPVNPNR